MFDLFNKLVAIISSIEMLGFTAGIAISLSALPQIVGNYTFHIGVARQSIARNALLVAGNLLWTTYGISKSLPAITTMCGVGAFLNAIVLTQICYARILITPDDWSERQ